MRVGRLGLIAACLIVFGLGASSGQAASALPGSNITLAWDASASTNIANYKLYYGTNSHSYLWTLSTASATQAVIANLAPETTYYFAVTAADDLGLESDYSAEIAFTVPVSKPALSMSRSGTKTVLRWQTNHAGFTLQWSSSPTGGWTSFSGKPPVSGTAYCYTNTVSSAQRYYRLMQ